MKTILELRIAKKEGRKISMVTCYDHWSAQLLNDTSIDTILVGDSLGMVVYGFDSTIGVTVDMMTPHVAAVRRGAPDKFVIGDMPFLSYRKGLADAMANVERMMSAGAQAVKIEGLRGNEELIEHLVESGVPVIGHLGLTPQFIHQMGGFKVQGRDEAAAERIFEDAQKAEQAGCDALVLEGIPDSLGTKISRALGIPTIGIGAGSGTDGQVLVLHDLLGLNCRFRPKFVRRFGPGAEEFIRQVNEFHGAVQSGDFPNAEESYQ
jgi:3-methyl-2-oxobutanoate hydroxymethyltransferase